MGPMRMGHSFWKQDCRGPGLSHTHSTRDHVGDDPNIHMHCPCHDCGLTPERWSQLTHPDQDDKPLELPQDGIPREPALATGELRTWVPIIVREKEVGGSYVDGDPRGPGRGLLHPAWVEWALTATWLS